MDPSELYPNPINTPAVSTIPPVVGAGMELEAPLTKKHSFWKTCLLIIFIIIGLVIIAFCSFRYLLSHGNDAKSVNDSALKLGIVTVPDTDNAYISLMQAVNTIYYPTEDATKIGDISSGKTWDETYAKNLLAKNQQTLVYFDQAAAKTSYQSPIYSDPSKVDINTTNKSLSQYRKLMRIKQIQNIWYDKHNQKSQALTGAMGLADLGYKMRNSQANLIHYLVATVIYKAGLTQINSFITTNKYSPQDLQKVSTQLEKYVGTDQGLINALKLEYLTFSKVIDNIVADLKAGKTTSASDAYGLPGTESYPKQIYYLEPNKTKQLFANDAQNVINHSAKPCIEFEKNKKYSAPKSKIRQAVTENMIGITLADMVAQSYSGVLDKSCQSEQLLNQVIANAKK